MREIRIVFNNKQEMFGDEQFSIYIDNKKQKNVDRFTLKATKTFPGETGFQNTDIIIKCVVEFPAPYFEEPESYNGF